MDLFLGHNKIAGMPLCLLSSIYDGLVACTCKAGVVDFQFALYAYIQYTQNTMHEVIESCEQRLASRTTLPRFDLLTVQLRLVMEMLVLFHRHWRRGLRPSNKPYRTWPHNCSMNCTICWKGVDFILLKRRKSSNGKRRPNALFSREFFVWYFQMCRCPLQTWC